MDVIRRAAMPNRYLASEELNGDGILWVVETASSGILGDGTYLSLRFHSRHKSLQDAQAVRRALEYDMEHPS